MSIFKLSVILLLFSGFPVFAQEEPDDIALNTDEFQIYFYESLKQKGIENYDKAIQALYKCDQLDPNNPVVFFELGKNYLLQKDYLNAYDNFKRATELDATNRWYWAGMYDAAYNQRNFDESISLLKKLIIFRNDYKEELVKLYIYSQQYDLALQLIDELTDTVGKSEQREQFRAQILATNRYQGQEEKKYLDGIKDNPKEESNYIALIYIYHDKNEDQKAFDIAKQLEKSVPDSDWAQLSLFKFYNEADDDKQMAVALEKILKSHRIDRKIKHRVFNELLIYVKNKPQLSSLIENAIPYFKDDNQVKVTKEVGKFYLNQNNWKQAEKYFEMHFKTDADDVGNLLLWCQSLTELKDYSKLQIKASSFVDLFPLQPEFYYYQGLALHQEKNFKKAAEVLEAGLDFVIENNALEAQFYIQLGEAYHSLGDMKKKEVNFQKAQKLMNP
ncbi:MAG: tetratricopeptide repeat protein [Flavobacterium sp.]